MAIDTQAKRNSALKDSVAVLFPSGIITVQDRETLVGDYWTTGNLPPPVIVGGPEFDVAEKPWIAEPNSFGFDNRMVPR